MSLLIGLDCREAFRENPRGIGLYARHLMREFGEVAPDDQFLAYHERPVPPDLPALAANIEARLVPMRGARWHLWEKLRMPWQMRRDKLSLYHGTYNTLPPRGPRWRATPMVVTLHDVIVNWWEHDEPGSYLGEHLRRVTPRVVREAARILTVSEWSKKDICTRYGVPEDKVVVFYNGVHPLFFEDPPADWGERARTQFAAGKPYLFSIGSPLKRKNTHGLLAALGLLKRSGRLQHPTVITGLVGKDFDHLQGVARDQGVLDEVHFHGYVTREELVSLYAGAVLTVYPSYAEGWGIPVVESFAVGTPVATSNTSAMPEAGGDFATYFDPADVESMADGIVRGLDGVTAFAARRDDAKARARAFTWRKAAEDTLAVYRDVLG